MSNSLFTRREVASIFNVTPHTVTQWRRAGLITPACWVNGRPRFTIEEIEKLAKVKTPAHETKTDNVNEQSD